MGDAPVADAPVGAGAPLARAERLLTLPSLTLAPFGAARFQHAGSESKDPSNPQHEGGH